MFRTTGWRACIAYYTQIFDDLLYLFCCRVKLERAYISIPINVYNLIPATKGNGKAVKPEINWLNAVLCERVCVCLRLCSYGTVATAHNAAPTGATIQNGWCHRRHCRHQHCIVRPLWCPSVVVPVRPCGDYNPYATRSINAFLFSLVHISVYVSARAPIKCPAA